MPGGASTAAFCRLAPSLVAGAPATTFLKPTCQAGHQRSCSPVLCICFLGCPEPCWAWRSFAAPRQGPSKIWREGKSQQVGKGKGCEWKAALSDRMWQLGGCCFGGTPWARCWASGGLGGLNAGWKKNSSAAAVSAIFTWRAQTWLSLSQSY